MRQLFVLLAVAAMAGCASESPAPVTVASAAPAASAPKQICEREQVTGSYRMQTVCYDADDTRDSNAVGNTKDSLSRQSGQTTQMLGRAGAGH
jgi:curli biogenesis system outer membrane secretion channel CsgG